MAKLQKAYRTQDCPTFKPLGQRLTARRDPAWASKSRCATYGDVILIAVDKVGEGRFYLMTLERQIPSTRLLRLWSRRTLIEQVVRTLKSLLATDACQVRSENAYYGHLVLRLIASFVLHYTSRILFKGRVSMDEMIFNIKHHWSSVDCEPLELYGLS